MALTLVQLQANLDAINNQIGDPTYSVHFPDGRSVTYRSLDDLNKAKATLQEDIRVASGASGGRVRLAQHKRGDGPSGPERFGWR